MRVSGGLYKNYKLDVPKDRVVRPTSGKLRQTVFDICRHQIEGAFFLDLFAGSGAMGIEALSRGARHATFIENHCSALRVIKQNIARLNLNKQTTLLKVDALKGVKMLAKKGQVFNLIYIDPPYFSNLRGDKRRDIEVILSLIDQNHLIDEAGSLFYEGCAMPEIPFPLKHLFLKKKRKFGASYLFQFDVCSS